METIHCRVIERHPRIMDYTSYLVDMRDEVMEVEKAGVETLVVQARVECHPVRIVVLKLQSTERETLDSPVSHICIVP